MTVTGERNAACAARCRAAPKPASVSTVAVAAMALRPADNKDIGERIVEGQRVRADDLARWTDHREIEPLSQLDRMLHAQPSGLARPVMEVQRVRGIRAVA